MINSVSSSHASHSNQAAQSAHQPSQQKTPNQPSALPKDTVTLKSGAANRPNQSEEKQ